MPNFVSFDDGLSYVNVNQVRRFEFITEEGQSPYTLIELASGDRYRTSRPIEEVAEMLESVNLWY